MLVKYIHYLDSCDNCSRLPCTKLLLDKSRIFKSCSTSTGLKKNINTFQFSTELIASNIKWKGSKYINNKYILQYAVKQTNKII